MSRSLINNSLVVRFHSIDVSSRVHEPCQIERERVTEHCGIPRQHWCLIPEVAGYPSRQKKAEYRHKNNVEPVIDKFRLSHHKFF